MVRKSPDRSRLGINRDLVIALFAGKGEYSKLVHEDMASGRADEAAEAAAVSKIVIERRTECRVTIHSAAGRRHRQEGRRHREAASWSTR